MDQENEAECLDELFTDTYSRGGNMVQYNTHPHHQYPKIWALVSITTKNFLPSNCIHTLWYSTKYTTALIYIHNLLPCVSCSHSNNNYVWYLSYLKYSSSSWNWPVPSIYGLTMLIICKKIVSQLLRKFRNQSCGYQLKQLITLTVLVTLRVIYMGYILP